jgi:hypothetical protein
MRKRSSSASRILVFLGIRSPHRKNPKREKIQVRARYILGAAELRLLNGMNPPVPEVTVLIHKITKDRRAGEYQLHIKKVLGFKHWNKRRRKPRR